MFRKKDVFKDVFDSKSKKYNLFINGKWIKPKLKEYREVRNPEDNKVVGFMPVASTIEANEALKSAVNGHLRMKKISVLERVGMFKKVKEMMLENSDFIIEVISRESGKPVSYAKGEFMAGLKRLDITEREIEFFHPKLIDGDYSDTSKGRKAYVYREPIGVVLAITPFNYPLVTPLSKIVPALLSGNSVILKPASDTPLTSFLIAKLFEIAGFPRGSLNVLTGSGKEIGDYLVSHKYVGMISFTGSTSVGKHIASICGMKRIHLELGGKGSAIVLKDADIKNAVKEIAAGAFKYSGQRCDAIGRVFVENNIYEKFKKELKKEVKRWKIGKLKSEKTLIGPLINERAVKHVEDLYNDAIKKGAKVLVGGKRKGLYFEPTVLEKVDMNMRIMWEETFGPVLPIMPVSSYKRAIKLNNESEYGLDSCVFTGNIELGIRIAKELDEGSTTINKHPGHGIGYFPFGGNKDSGVGREGIFYSLEEMTVIKTIVL